MYEIKIDGDLEHLVNVYELDHLSIQLSINEDGDQHQWHCTGCGEETGDESLVIDGMEPCDGSGNTIDCPEHIIDGDGNCETCDGSGEIEIHEWESIPLHWVNSASIHARPDRDEIQVTISIGDPRGAFVMSVERRDDGLYLSVPHADMGMSHMSLTERSPGWFKIG